jgi:hypothetical protein
VKHLIWKPGFNAFSDRRWLEKGDIFSDVSKFVHHHKEATKHGHERMH